MRHVDPQRIYQPVWLSVTGESPAGLYWGSRRGPNDAANRSRATQRNFTASPRGRAVHSARHDHYAAEGAQAPTVEEA